MARIFKNVKSRFPLLEQFSPAVPETILSTVVSTVDWLDARWCSRRTRRGAVCCTIALPFQGWRWASLGIQMLHAVYRSLWSHMLHILEKSLQNLFCRFALRKRPVLISCAASSYRPVGGGGMLLVGVAASNCWRFELHSLGTEFGHCMVSLMIGTERLFVLVWILELRFLEKSTKTLSNFQARKICHAGPAKPLNPSSSEDNGRHGQKR